MPLVYPFRTASGNAVTMESVLVRMVTDQGACGWGEATPWKDPGYSPECAAGVFLMLREFLVPLVLGRSFESGAALQEAMVPVKGNFFAKAALDLAWWDLHAKERNEPLYRVLGGKRDVVEVGADFGVMETIESLLEAIAGAAEQGFKRVKLKFRPGWDNAMVERVRGSFPDMVFHVDCNSAYTLKDSAMLKELDRFNLAMIEQPLAHDDLLDHATLQKQLRTPICLDESITSPDKARKAVELGSCGWVNIKPGRVGGLTRAVEIHDICFKAGIPCWVGGMLESALGAHHCMALATLPNFTYPNDIFPTNRFYNEDISRPEVCLHGPSLMRLPDGPGCGAEPVRWRLCAATIESATLGKS